MQILIVNERMRFPKELPDEKMSSRSFVWNMKLDESYLKNFGDFKGIRHFSRERTIIILE